MVNKKYKDRNEINAKASKKQIKDAVKKEDKEKKEKKKALIKEQNRETWRGRGIKQLKIAKVKPIFLVVLLYLLSKNRKFNILSKTTVFSS